MTGLIQESKFFARIDLTSAVSWDTDKMDELVKLSDSIKIINREIRVDEEGETESHIFLYSYLTFEEYQEVKRDRKGYCICPKTSYTGVLDLL